VTLVAFKAIDPVLRGQGGGFDSHTLPPTNHGKAKEGSTHVYEPKRAAPSSFRVGARDAVCGSTCLASIRMHTQTMCGPPAVQLQASKPRPDDYSYITPAPCHYSARARASAMMDNKGSLSAMKRRTVALTVLVLLLGLAVWAARLNAQGACTPVAPAPPLGCTEKCQCYTDQYGVSHCQWVAVCP